MNTTDYEVEVEHKGEYYLVGANLYSDGEWEDIPDSKDEAGGLEVMKDPVFCEWSIEGPDGKLPFDKLVKKAEVILREVYWERICGEI